MHIKVDVDGSIQYTEVDPEEDEQTYNNKIDDVFSLFSALDPKEIESVEIVVRKVEDESTETKKDDQ